MRHRFLRLPRVAQSLVVVSLFSVVAVAVSGCGALNAIGGANTNYFPPNLPHPTPTVTTFHNCPPQGQGGDPALNTLENRQDEAGANGYRITDLTQVMTVPSTPQIEGKDRSAWSSADAKRVALYEGSAVRTTGWVVAVRYGGPTAANCDSTTDRDWYLWIATGGGDIPQTAMVVVVTPRIRAERPGWTDYSLRRLVGQVVRVSGWMVYDQEPPSFVANDRTTPWELQPVMHLETLYLNQWINLDLIPFGPNTSGTPAATAPGVVTPITPLTPTSGA